MLDILIYLLLWWAIRRRPAPFSPIVGRWPLHERAQLTHGSSATHPGVDICPVDDRGRIATSSQASVYPIADGTVIAATSQASGHWVAVHHHNGVVSAYGHLASLDVHVGQTVTSETALGTVGFDPTDPQRVIHVHLQALGPDRTAIAPETLLAAHEGDLKEDR